LPRSTDRCKDDRVRWQRRGRSAGPKRTDTAERVNAFGLSAPCQEGGTMVIIKVSRRTSVRHRPNLTYAERPRLCFSSSIVP
jgi:hypothetical protein